MRPSDITDGKVRDRAGWRRIRNASMRPSDITDGKFSASILIHSETRCFNEAVGYYRRKVTDQGGT